MVMKVKTITVGTIALALTLGMLVVAAAGPAAPGDDGDAVGVGDLQDRR